MRYAYCTLRVLRRWVPLRWMFGKTKPEDGSDVCKFK
jgi:hypothetical protein